MTLDGFLHRSVGAILPLTSTLASHLFAAGGVLSAIWKLARCLLRFRPALLLPKSALAARIPAAESRLALSMNRSGGSTSV